MPRKGWEGSKKYIVLCTEHDRHLARDIPEPIALHYCVTLLLGIENILEWGSWSLQYVPEVQYWLYCITLLFIS